MHVLSNVNTFLVQYFSQFVIVAEMEWVNVLVGVEFAFTI